MKHFYSIYRISVLALCFCAIFIFTGKMVLGAEIDTDSLKANIVTAVQKAALTLENANTTYGPIQIDQSLNNDNQDLIALTRPAVVRIIIHSLGTSTIPALWPNIEAFEWGPAWGVKPVEFPFDEYAFGSGFIFNPDGYILTNAHVVSDEILKLQIASEMVTALMYQKFSNLTYAENAILEKRGYDQSDYEQLALDGILKIKDKITLPSTPEVAVLRPNLPQSANSNSALQTRNNYAGSSGIKTQARELFDRAIKAKVISKHNNFLNDEKDFAIIKIDEENLPVLRLGNSDNVSTGNVVFAFGYPAAADYNEFTTEPSFTSGTVNALKDSTQHTFKYIQTDAAVSEGSSGGPLLNKKGEVIGLITMNASTIYEGSIFAFAIPLNITKQTIGDLGIATSTKGDYPDLLLRALSLYRQNRCEEANILFKQAMNVNDIFGGSSEYIEPYIKTCAELIASGQSVSVNQDEIILDDKYNYDFLKWIIIIVSVVAVLLVLGVFFMYRKIHKEGVLIKKLEEQIDGQTQSTEKVVSGVNDEIKTDPRLLSYISEARKQGMAEDQIREELAKAGWQSTDIEKAFSVDK